MKIDASNPCVPDANRSFQTVTQRLNGFSERRIERSDLMTAWRSGMPMGGEMKPVERKCEATVSNDDYQSWNQASTFLLSRHVMEQKSEERL
jgi:hypothetical protein